MRGNELHSSRASALERAQRGHGPRRPQSTRAARSWFLPHSVSRCSNTKRINRRARGQIRSGECSGTTPRWSRRAASTCGRVQRYRDGVTAVAARSRRKPSLVAATAAPRPFCEPKGGSQLSVTRCADCLSESSSYIAHRKERRRLVEQSAAATRSVVVRGARTTPKLPVPSAAVYARNTGDARSWRGGPSELPQARKGSRLSRASALARALRGRGPRRPQTARAARTWLLPHVASTRVVNTKNT